MKKSFTLLLLVLLATPFFAQTVLPEDIRFVEVMQNPADVSDAVGEWFEIQNNTNSNINIDGWIIRDKDTDLDTISNGGSLIIPANGFLVMGVNADTATNGGYIVDYQWGAGNMFLGNSIDELILQMPNGTIIDSIQWDNGVTFPDPNGASMVFTGCAGTDNNLGANWTTATQRESSYSNNGGSDAGSPGTAGIDQAPPSGASLTSSSVNLSCAGSNDGKAFVSIKSCMGPFTISWSNGSNNYGVLEDSITGLSPGIYIAVISDSMSFSQTLTFNITAPPGSQINAQVSPASCGSNNDGAIDLSVSGAAPFTFLWSNSATTEDISGLSAGTYTVTVTDSNGCQTLDTITVNQVNGISSLSLTSVANLCFGDSSGGINLTVFGGTPPYTYLWSTGATTQNLINAFAGTHSVIVTDSNGCSFTSSGTITPPAPVSLSTVVTDEVCAGDLSGGINLIVSGGTSPYSYLWNNSATTEDISGIGPGTYTVTVTDNNGCSQFTSATVAPGQSISLGMSSTAETGNAMDGTATALPSGGTMPYTYLWTPSGQTSQTATGLATGVYTCTVTDSKGCMGSDTITVGHLASIFGNRGIEGLDLYPNPARDRVSISAQVRLDRISIFDAQGRMAIVTKPGQNQAEISLQTLENGIYLVRVEAGEKVSHGKLLIQR